MLQECAAADWVRHRGQHADLRRAKESRRQRVETVAREYGAEAPLTYRQLNDIYCNALEETK